MSIAWMMMLHTAIHWPEMADSSLWPMVVQHATFLHNNMPNPTTGLVPMTYLPGRDLMPTSFMISMSGDVQLMF